MGIIHSVFCSVTFCVERVLTWLCCALLLMTLLMTILLLMVYGISMGYHYAQKELAMFAMSARAGTTPKNLMYRRSDDVISNSPAVSTYTSGTVPYESYTSPSTKKETEARRGFRPYPYHNMPIEIDYGTRPTDTTLAAHERHIARKIIGRFRRSKPGNGSSSPVFRPRTNDTT